MKLKTALKNNDFFKMYMRTIKDNKKFNIKKSDLKDLIVKAQIMIDYLDFINKPLMFYIARDYKLDPGLHELVPLRKKIDDAEWDRIKVAFYYWFDKKVDLRVKVRQTVSLHKNNKTKFEEWLDERLEAEEEKRIAEFKEMFNSNGKNKSNQDPIEKVKEITQDKKDLMEMFALIYQIARLIDENRVTLDYSVRSNLEKYFDVGFDSLINNLHQ